MILLFLSKIYYIVYKSGFSFIGFTAEFDPIQTNSHLVNMKHVRFSNNSMLEQLLNYVSIIEINFFLI